MKASDLLVRCLEAEGVEYIFGIPGEETIDLMDSLTRSSIRFVLTRHEQGAAFMADAYGRLTGKPGVCLATLGPGATNLVTGVANAHLDNSPVIAITSQAITTRLHKESHQNIDTIKLFNGITKYNQQIVSASTIPEIIRKSFAHAVAESAGAVHLQLPADVAKEEIEASPLPVKKQAASSPDPISLFHASSLIAGAEKPIVLAGNGVIRSHAAVQLLRFIEKSNLPLVHTYMAKGILPSDHPNNLYTVGGTSGSDCLLPLLEADLIIAVGYDLVEYDPVVWNEDSSRKVLNIHTVPAETDTHYPVVLDLVGDIRNSLETLTTAVLRRPDIPSFVSLREQRIDEMLQMPEGQELPRSVMRTLSETLPEDAIVIADVGLHKVWVSRWYQPKAPGRTIIYNGFASMGASLPAAVSACLVRPQSQVIVVSGDGGFLMNAQELETARRLGLVITVIIFNDKCLSLIEKHQREASLAVTQTTFTNPDFQLFAHSFGAEHRRASNAKEFSQALQEALESGTLNLLEIVL
ncbi:acetolactate synthase large subunit [Paenibacillus polysaccharolyticus]|uniref:acetolactate synthase large subunit n=1 Tax=Paenibacillus polysaccharolyticus TaxID=582692 RepID=UPI00209F13C9|nr:acetolactate synthase large subunit [Paenibacillus polysaccharolyticus]MCP1136221.1 acetolactate synthase large subunit [Paenibacillus polysaccharolyticus]